MARLSIFYSLLSIPYLVPSAQGNPHYKVIRAAPASPATPAIPPSQDPWYSAPDGYESTAPGAVLKIRKSPDLESRKAFVRNCSDIYNILYRTTDSNYKPSWAVTTLFVPLANSSATTSTNTNSIKPLGDRLLSYQTSCEYQFRLPTSNLRIHKSSTINNSCSDRLELTTLQMTALASI